MVFACSGLSAQQWVRYEGATGPGKGKHIVLVSGDDEYRSEEALPMLAAILSKKYGFTCTVLFAIDPQTGEIDAGNLHNIPGLEALKNADLMVMFTRFRELPDSQMKLIDDYLMSGKPVIGMRTATHAFHYTNDTTGKFSKYDFQSKKPQWKDGFGRLVLGETWIDHHGHHGHEGTRGLINGVEQKKKNTILNGVSDIWVPTDVYEVRDMPGATVLVYGQSTNGMTASAPVNLEKSIMPVAWTKTYQLPGGRKGKVFATTMGAAIDLTNEDLRRLMINACFWATGLANSTPEKADVSFVSDYKPTMFGFDKFIKGKSPSSYELK